jgi:hypothetical protein
MARRYRRRSAAAAAERVASWPDAAVRGGARILFGSGRAGPMHQTTLLDSVAPDAEVMTREVFGPLICVIGFDDIDEAVSGANEASSSWIDLMSLGGVKCSGHGEEGPRYAAREMSEERLSTISY